MLSTEYIIQRTLPRREGGGTAPLGTVEELVALFGRMNTAPDQRGSIQLYGPGIRIQFNVEGGRQAAHPADVVTSIRLDVIEEELFRLLLEGTSFERPGRLAATIRQHGWTLVNTESGYCYPQQRDDDDEDEDADGVNDRHGDGSGG